jgi:hypothetical protein
MDGRWSLVVGRWSLVVGRWSLVVGHVRLKPDATPAHVTQVSIQSKSAIANQQSAISNQQFR